MILSSTNNCVWSKQRKKNSIHKSICNLYRIFLFCLVIWSRATNIWKQFTLMFFMVQFNEITKQKNCKRYCNQSKENVNTKKSHALINGRLYHDLIFFKCKLGSILFNSLTHVLLFLFLTFIEHEYVQCCCLDTNKHSEFFSLFSVTYFHSFFFK